MLEVYSTAGASNRRSRWRAPSPRHRRLRPRAARILARPRAAPRRKRDGHLREPGAALDSEVSAEETDAFAHREKAETTFRSGAGEDRRCVEPAPVVANAEGGGSVGDRQRRAHGRRAAVLPDVRE